MTDHELGGQPYASGREADVFLLDEKRVLRRYRAGPDAAREAALMTYVRGLGFPVPEVFEAGGTDLVMERVDGPTMVRAVLAGSMSLGEAAAVLADLLRRLHELPAQAGAGTIVHFDLHPENVLLTADGPMVIDWPNGGDGPADLDTALTALILAEVTVGAIAHPMGAAAAQLLDRFLELAPGDPIRMLGDAVARRSRNPRLSATEIGRLGDAANRVRGAGEIGRPGDTATGVQGEEA